MLLGEGYPLLEFGELKKGDYYLKILVVQLVWLLGDATVSWPTVYGQTKPSSSSVISVILARLLLIEVAWYAAMTGNSSVTPLVIWLPFHVRRIKSYLRLGSEMLHSGSGLATTMPDILKSVEARTSLKI